MYNGITETSGAKGAGRADTNVPGPRPNPNPRLRPRVKLANFGVARVSFRKFVVIFR